MSAEFWYGLALSIPLSIVGNLLSSPLQKWIEARSQRAADRARRKREEHHEKLRLAKADTFELFAFGFIRLLIIGVVGAGFAIAANFLFALPNVAWLLDSLQVRVDDGMLVDAVSSGSALVAMLLQVLGFLLVINISMSTVREIQAMRKVEL